jgi:hypothetical protein
LSRRWSWRDDVNAVLKRRDVQANDDRTVVSDQDLMERRKSVVGYPEDAVVRH